MSAGNKARAKRYNAERSRVADAGARRRRSGVVDDQLMIAGVEDVRARWAEYDACFTPTPVAQQLIELLPAIRGVRLPRRGRLLDPCAGAGVIGMVARALVGYTRTAVEPRIEEREHLERHHDHVHILTAQQFAAEWAERNDPRPYELVITNPPWWCWGEIWRATWPLVADGGLLVLLGPSTWGHSDETSEAIDVFDEVPPHVQLRIRGRVAFNGGTSTDNRKCSWWVWAKQPRAHADEWITTTLPALPPEARCWRTRPGTEEAP